MYSITRLWTCLYKYGDCLFIHKHTHIADWVNELFCCPDKHKHWEQWSIGLCFHKTYTWNESSLCSTASFMCQSVPNRAVKEVCCIYAAGCSQFKLQCKMCKITRATESTVFLVIWAIFVKVVMLHGVFPDSTNRLTCFKYNCLFIRNNTSFSVM